MKIYAYFILLICSFPIYSMEIASLLDQIKAIDALELNQIDDAKDSTPQSESPVCMDQAADSKSIPKLLRPFYKDLLTAASEINLCKFDYDELGRKSKKMTNDVFQLIAAFPGFRDPDHYSAKNPCGELVLRCAAIFNSVGIIKMILDLGVKIDAVTKPREKTALMYCAQLGHIEAAEYLLKRGAKINAQNVSGFTALVIAAAEGRVEMVDFLIQKGADVRVTGQRQNNAIMQAIKEIANYQSYERCIKIIDLLSKAGLSINDKNQAHRTPLIIASMYNEHNIVRHLLALGADIKVRDCKDFTALDWAKKRHVGNEMISELVNILQKAHTDAEKMKPMTPPSRKSSQGILSKLVTGSAS